LKPAYTPLGWRNSAGTRYGQTQKLNTGLAGKFWRFLDRPSRSIEVSAFGFFWLTQDAEWLEQRIDNAVSFQNNPVVGMREEKIIIEACIKTAIKRDQGFVNRRLDISYRSHLKGDKQQG
ncbi:MAG: hypothetical protein GY789_11500, partial [Hyphomicrobiales bacterium]|nr:hypothetical protein [Hyphomicrobiales bacterium]